MRFGEGLELVERKEMVWIKILWGLVLSRWELGLIGVEFEV